MLVVKSPNFELPKLYPWMVRANEEVDPASWEVSFARTGLPLKIEPSVRTVTEPELTYIKKSPIDYSYLTQERIAGRGATAHLTEKGSVFMRLLIWPE